MQYPHATSIAFWNRVEAHRPSECWPWKGSRQATGYGTLYVGEQALLAHRVSYEIHNGPIGEGLFICHRCDNPPCVNPDHLFAGTPRDNTQDMISKGRRKRIVPSPERCGLTKWNRDHGHERRRGSKHHAAKITEAIVSQIKAAISAGETGASIAARFGCSSCTVSLIKRGKQWRHVP